MVRTAYDPKTERLEVLSRYAALDTEPEPSFERVIALAQRLFEVPIVLITLVAEEKAWFKARVDLDLRELSRDGGFCDHTIRQDGVMVVHDAQKDPRFRDDPLVTGVPGTRFYAGAPLKAPTGHNLGALCILDTAPHDKFSDEAGATLTDLAAVVMDALESRRAATGAAVAARTLRVSEARLRLLIGQVPAVFWTTDRELRFTATSGKDLARFGQTPDQVTGLTLHKHFGMADPAFPPLAAHLRALGGDTASYEVDVASRTFRAHVEPLRDDSGEISGCLGVALDVTEDRQAENALRLVNEELAHVLGSISDAVWSAEVGPAGFVYRYFSPVIEALTGRPPEFFRVSPDAWLSIVHPDDRAGLERAAKRVVTGKVQGEHEYRIVRADGSLRWVCDRVRAVSLPDGARRLYGVLSDTTVRKEAEQRAAHQVKFRRELLAAVMETTLRRGLDASFYGRLLECAVRAIPGAEAGSLVLCDVQSRCTYVAAVGYDLGQLQGSCVREGDFRTVGQAGPQLILAPGTLEPDDLVSDDLVPSNLEPGNNASKSEYTLLCSTGRPAAVRVSLSLPVEIDGKNVAYFNLDNFVTTAAFDAEAVEMARVFAQQVAVFLRRFELEDAFEHLAYHDPLTGLPNRRLFEKHLAHALAKSWDGGAPFAVVLLDLDDFRIINDSRGHAFGDGVLKGLAARLGETLRGGDSLARWEGDAFAILAADVADEEAAAHFAERLLSSCRSPLMLAGQLVRVTASLGVDLYPGGAEQPEELMRHADIALYHAKATGDGYRVFDEPMNQRVQSRLQLEADFREALPAGALSLHYQPRVGLADGQTRSLEALARWHHPTRGWVAPSVFVPLAEQIGLIAQLGDLVLDTACAQAKAWAAAGLATRVAVNVSAEQLRAPDFVAAVKRTLERHELAPALLELEITESTAMADIEDGIVKLRTLRDLGVYLSIDDFGTAYSSLAYLEQLPVHSLKIDQTFVRELGGCTGGGASIIEAVVALARSFQLTVVAEGVETEVQRRTLLALGCGEAQGFLFAKPLPAAEVSRFLRRTPGAA